jgi:hypothetical protein
MDATPLWAVLGCGKFGGVTIIQLVRSNLLRPPQLEIFPKNQKSIRHRSLGSVANFVLAFSVCGLNAIPSRGHMTIRRVLTHPQGGTR